MIRRMPLRRLPVCPVVLLALAQPAHAADHPVAVITEARGAVSVQRGRLPARTAAAGARLLDGDLLSTGKGGSARVLMARTGGRWQLGAGARAAVHASLLRRVAGTAPRRLPAVSARLLRAAGTLGEDPLPRLRGGALRGGQSGRGPHTPRPVGAVEDTGPLLAWDGDPHPDAARRDGRISVVVRDAEDSTLLFSAELPLDARQVRLPEGTLRPGRWALWSATVVDSTGAFGRCGGPVRVLTAAERAQMDLLEAEAESARRSAPGDPTPDLLAARAASRYGMFTRAADLYRAVLARGANPVAQKALERIHALAGGVR